MDKWQSIYIYIYAAYKTKVEYCDDQKYARGHRLFFLLTFRLPGKDYGACMQTGK
jgi:hypothetical protein